ncbi:hypothetical protein SeGA_3374, partial [Salmonella enterica subsp. enterica serovar Gaminara str. A4-567]
MTSASGIAPLAKPLAFVMHFQVFHFVLEQHRFGVV